MPKRSPRNLLEKYIPKTYAIKFDSKHDAVAGMYLTIINAHVGCVALNGGIFLVGENVVKALDENKIRYKKFRVNPGNVDGVYKEAKRRGWFKQW